jgi:hypothetical protein
MRFARAGALLTVVGAIALTGTARADQDRPVSVGPYAEAGIGATSFLGEGADHAAIGPSFAVRLGYDVFSWFSLGIRVDASSHEATVPPPPEGEYFQLYTGAAEGRLGFSIGRVGVFADGGIGGALISTNVLQKVAVLDPGEELTIVFNAGGGLEYQLQNRHYAFGLAAHWTMLPAFDSLQSVTYRGYLRYTY